MENNSIVDSETFFKMIVKEIKNENTGCKQYIFCRVDDELWFYGFATNFFVNTKIINENQFRNYYEQLQDTFGDDFCELLEFGSIATVYAIIKNKVITIEGSYDYEPWISDKLVGRYTKEKKKGSNIYKERI
ncbi:MAG: hypothetical protein VZS44_06640 [Bacilli bacterium]|nr:hypothetical protein [Bacilli bacterium]